MDSEINLQYEILEILKEQTIQRDAIIKQNEIMIKQFAAMAYTMSEWMASDKKHHAEENNTMRQVKIAMKR